RRDVLALAQLVPAHVRHFQTRHLGEAYHLAGKQVEAAVFAILVTGREQELHAQADAEELLALADVLPDRRRQPALVETSDGVAEGADTRQYQLVALRDAVRIGADLRREANLLEGLLHAAQVRHPIIDNQDSLHRSPLWRQVSNLPGSNGKLETCRHERHGPAQMRGAVSRELISSEAHDKMPLTASAWTSSRGWVR